MLIEMGSVHANQFAIKLGCYLKAVFMSSSPVHKLLGSFSATLGFFDNFQLVEQLSMHRVTSKFCVSIVTVMLLLRVKQLKSAEYKNIARVENIFVQSFSFTIRLHMFP